MAVLQHVEKQRGRAKRGPFEALITTKILIFSLLFLILNRTTDVTNANNNALIFLIVTILAFEITNLSFIYNCLVDAFAVLRSTRY